MDSTLPFYGFFWILVAVENASPFVVLLLAFFSHSSNSNSSPIAGCNNSCSIIVATIARSTIGG
jgi:hypothetical protein